MLLTLIGTLCRSDSSSDEIVCLLKGADPKDHRMPLVRHRNVIKVRMMPIQALRNLDSRNQSTTKGPSRLRASTPLTDQSAELFCAKDVVSSCSCIGSPSLDVIVCTPLPAKAALPQILHSCLGFLAHCVCSVGGGKSGRGRCFCSQNRLLNLGLNPGQWLYACSRLMCPLTTPSRGSDKRMFRRSSLRSLIRSFTTSALAFNAFSQSVVMCLVG